MSFGVVAVAGGAALALVAHARGLSAGGRLDGLAPRRPCRVGTRRFGHGSDSGRPGMLVALGRWRADAMRSRALRRELPVLVELMRMALSAGLTPTQGLRVVARLGPPTSRGLLTGAVSALDLGTGLAGALERLRAAAPDLAGLADALGASADLGVGVEETLARLGADARASVRRAAEARARTVPVRLLFPLVLCVLPAFALLAVAPSLLAGLSA